MGIADCTAVFGCRCQGVCDFHPFKIFSIRGSAQIAGPSSPRISDSVGLGWDPRIGISNKLPGDANGDAVGAGTTTRRLRCPNITGHLFREFCFECIPSRRENRELVNREEEKKGQKNISSLLQEGSC